jgi:hypothetical protein
MAYQHDPDGPVVDRGLFRAVSLAKAAVWFIIFAALSIGIYLIFPKSKRIDTAIDITRIELNYSPYNWSYENTDDALTISLWADGMTAKAKKAYSGNEEALKSWQKIKDNVNKYVHSIHVNLSLQEVEDITVTIKLLNDENRERSLLVYKNESLIYDIMNDR